MNKKSYIIPQLMTETKFLMKETLCAGSTGTGSQTTIGDNTNPTDRDDEGVIGDDTGAKGRGMEFGNIW